MGWQYRIRAVIAIAATALTASACGDDGTGLDDLEDQRERWEAQGISDYTYDIRRNCFCGHVNPVRVTVRDGQRIRAYDLERELELIGEEATWYPTVDGLFDILEDAYARDAFSVRVEYDPQMGYPTSFFIDYSENMADEELGFDVLGPIVVATP